MPVSSESAVPWNSNIPLAFKVLGHPKAAGVEGRLTKGIKMTVTRIVLISTSSLEGLAGPAVPHGAPFA